MTEISYELVQASSPEDWEALHDLRRLELFARKKGVVYDTNHPDDRAAKNFPLVFKLNGKSIGTARLDVFDNGEGVIRLVAIAKEEQRKGYGRILEQKFEAFARSNGVSKLLVNANPTAVGYYEKLGFVHEEWNDPAGRLSGIGKDSIPMRKII
ncbi:MAG: GNAT family N-acetyltransferase [Patescibacteria group bacterium]